MCCRCHWRELPNLRSNEATDKNKQGRGFHCKTICRIKTTETANQTGYLNYGMCAKLVPYLGGRSIDNIIRREGTFNETKQTGSI